MEMSIEKRNQFIEKNMGLIGKIAKSYIPLANSTGYSYDDLVNSGVIGMIAGIENYDESKGVPLEAFVQMHIRRVISEFIAKPRKHDRLENKLSLQEQISNNNGEYVTLEEMLANTPSSDSPLKFELGTLRKILKSDLLTDIEKTVIRLRFVEEMKHKDMDKEVRKITGKEKSRAFYYLNQAIGKLQRAMV